MVGVLLYLIVRAKDINWRKKHIAHKLVWQNLELSILIGQKIERDVCCFYTKTQPFLNAPGGALKILNVSDKR